MERNIIVPQKQQGYGDWQQDHSDPGLPQKRYSGNIYTEKAWWTRQQTGYPRLGRFCEENQDNIQQQDEGSKCWMEDRIFQVGKEEHHGFYDWIWGINHEGGHRWVACHFSVGEEYLTGHN